MPACHVEDSPDDEYHADEDGTHVFRNRNVPRTHFGAVGLHLDNLAFVFRVGAPELERDVAVAIHMSMLQTRRRKDVQSVGRPHYHRQRNAAVMIEGHLPAEAIAQVLEDDIFC